MFAKKECSPKWNVRQKGMFAKKECSPKELANVRRGKKS
jgi:hypothetical protein